jgi:hypothetical protein
VFGSGAADALFRLHEEHEFFANPLSMNVVKQDAEINGDGFAPVLTVMY